MLCDTALTVPTTAPTEATPTTAAGEGSCVGVVDTSGRQDCEREDCRGSSVLLLVKE